MTFSHKPIVITSNKIWLNSRLYSNIHQCIHHASVTIGPVVITVNVGLQSIDVTIKVINSTNYNNIVTCTIMCHYLVWSCNPRYQQYKIMLQCSIDHHNACNSCIHRYHHHNNIARQQEYIIIRLPCGANNLFLCKLRCWARVQLHRFRCCPIVYVKTH